MSEISYTLFSNIARTATDTFCGVFLYSSLRFINLHRLNAGDDDDFGEGGGGDKGRVCGDYDDDDGGGLGSVNFQMDLFTCSSEKLPKKLANYSV